MGHRSTAEAPSGTLSESDDDLEPYALEEGTNDEGDHCVLVGGRCAAPCMTSATERAVKKRVSSGLAQAVCCAKGSIVLRAVCEAAAGAEEDEQGSPLQLRDVMALLRKADDPASIMRGLSALPPLLQAEPDELRTRAGARPLQQCRWPSSAWHPPDCRIF